MTTATKNSRVYRVVREFSGMTPSGTYESANHVVAGNVRGAIGKDIARGGKLVRVERCNDEGCADKVWHY